MDIYQSPYYAFHFWKFYGSFVAFLFSFWVGTLLVWLKSHFFLVSAIHILTQSLTHPFTHALSLINDHLLRSPLPFVSHICGKMWLLSHPHLVFASTGDNNLTVSYGVTNVDYSLLIPTLLLVNGIATFALTLSVRGRLRALETLKLYTEQTTS